MSDDSLLDLSDDVISLQVNLQDVLNRLTPHKKAAKRGTQMVWLREADKLLIAATSAVEEASLYLDMVVETQAKEAES